MTVEKLYTYLGKNGTVTTPVYLEGVPAMITYRLKADKNKVLTNGTAKTSTATVLPENLKNWKEIEP